MLTIRLNRTGKKNQPFFQIVVTDKRNAPRGGRFIEKVGYLNPLTKEFSLKKERIKYWIDKGAKCSDRVHNLLIKEKVLEGKKISVLKKKKKKEGEKTELKEKTIEKPIESIEEKPKEEQKQEVQGSEEKKEEKQGEKSGEKPKEETDKEPKIEEKKESKTEEKKEEPKEEKKEIKKP